MEPQKYFDCCISTHCFRPFYFSRTIGVIKGWKSTLHIDRQNALVSYLPFPSCRWPQREAPCLDGTILEHNINNLGTKRHSVPYVCPRRRREQRRLQRDEELRKVGHIDNTNIDSQSTLARGRDLAPTGSSHFTTKRLPSTCEDGSHTTYILEYKYQAPARLLQPVFSCSSSHHHISPPNQLSLQKHSLNAFQLHSTIKMPSTTKNTQSSNSSMGVNGYSYCVVM